ncbi:hypothetical protein A2772_01040 [Candidatus Daviesbacteria bacterium RIFCSPHIGHO2_01_FULL_38_8b]|nr:MAG: hypothetical protein A2772_01040 [Candidatus Daviesbacteria bacterium RIFCSPHIGHO2_01_FULL_38_8b]
MYKGTGKRDKQGKKVFKVRIFLKLIFLNKNSAKTRVKVKMMAKKMICKIESKEPNKRKSFKGRINSSIIFITMEQVIK